MPTRNPFNTRRLPAPPRMLAMLGPGLVWMALAQGSGELTWWPYLVAKFALASLFLLVPACLLQYPLTFEIGHYSLLTGEGVFRGSFRLNKWCGLFLWAMFTVSFLWFGAFASAAGTAIYCGALVILNHGLIRRQLAETLRPSRAAMALLVFVTLVYAALASAYVWARLSGR